MTVVDLVLFAVGWTVGWVLFWRSRPLPAMVPAVRRRRSIVVPARNEEANLPALLSSLAPQLSPGDECLVVDDGSTDATAAVAVAHGARVVAAPPLPDGWTGKAWACHTGASEATGGLLVFLDADVTLAPDTLDRLDAATTADCLVSVQPWHRTVRPFEQLSVFFNVTALMGSSGFTAFGRRVRARVAFGPVLATTADGYRRVGGHAHPDVRRSLVEDIALRRLYADVALYTGKGAATFRMYPDGVRSLIQGWTKNIATGFGSIAWWFGVAVVAWIWSLAGSPFTSPWLYAASAVQVWVLGWRAGRFGPITAALYPVLLLFFLVVFLRSLALTALRRPMRWRGRVVSR